MWDVSLVECNFGMFEDDIGPQYAIPCAPLYQKSNFAPGAPPANLEKTAQHSTWDNLNTDGGSLGITVIPTWSNNFAFLIRGIRNMLALGSLLFGEIGTQILQMALVRP